MDEDIDFLEVRFHFGGTFVNNGPRNLEYFGGRKGYTVIERDKVSLPELRAHLRDH